MADFPVIRSTLSPKELGQFIQVQYQLGKEVQCELFRTGINHTYFISDQQLKYTIRVYSFQWRTKTAIEEEIRLLNFLKQNNLSISYPIKDKDGQFIQEINAPEGRRYAVLFSFAEGKKVRFMSEANCAKIGSFMAKFHQLSINTKLNRTYYNKQSLVDLPYQNLKPYFSEELEEMAFIREMSTTFQDSSFKHLPRGTVHMDMWYDNMLIKGQNEPTIFDFDFCGNGWLVLDIAYFCKQLFFIENNKAQYEMKVKAFLEAYQKVRKLSNEELQSIPMAGVLVFIFYLGVQARRFDWSNIFLSENYLKMFVGRIKTWMHYQENKISTLK
jgi:Ser/Thr protein kinase RdoA (MazF antagonist)